MVEYKTYGHMKATLKYVCHQGLSKKAKKALATLWYVRRCFMVFIFRVVNVCIRILIL